MGVGMRLYAQFVQTKISNAKVLLYYNVIIRNYLTSVTDPGKLFHSSITLIENKYFLVSH